MREHYLKKAEENFPELYEKIILPKAEPQILETGGGVVLDLGAHYVGYFSFKLDYLDCYLDAPVKIYVKFCETERELDDDFSDYHGRLCSSWLQEEVVNLDFPGVYNMPRRYAARFIEIKILATPRKLSLSDFSFKAVTSADEKKLEKCECSDTELLKIDEIAANTLKNCMQRVFEDGPKRDRRLWSGDLHLEALANYYTFGNLELVKRCLYLFAAADVNDKGFIPGYIYENPSFVSGEWFLEDYAMLFVASVCDYYNYTKDAETFFDLYPAVKAQLEAMHNTLDGDGIATVAEGCGAFIDWCADLMKVTSLHGIYLYTLDKVVNTLENLSCDDGAIYRKRLDEARKSAFDVLYDKENNIFASSKDQGQHSVHSVVWMILGGVIEVKRAEDALNNVLAEENALKPFTPYMHHYVVEAMVKLGLADRAKEYIKSYWGGMAEKGADTFYEVYVPKDDNFSPYGDRKINSMCHAWSCTPAYFVRKYFS